MRMIKNQITVYLNDETLNELEKQRGTTKKTVFIEQALMRELGIA